MTSPLSNFTESSKEDLRSGNLFGERKSTFLLIFPGQRIRDTRDNDVIFLIQVASLILCYTVRVISENIRGVFSIAAVPSLELTLRKRPKIYGCR